LPGIRTTSFFSVVVVTGDLAAQGFGPPGNYCRGVVWGYIAAITAINVDGLVEAISDIRNKNALSQAAMKKNNENA